MLTLINKIVEENNYLRKTFLNINDDHLITIEDNFCKIFNSKITPKRNHTEINCINKNEVIKKAEITCKENKENFDLFGIKNDYIKLYKENVLKCKNDSKEEYLKEKKQIYQSSKTIGNTWFKKVNVKDFIDYQDVIISKIKDINRSFFNDEFKLSKKNETINLDAMSKENITNKQKKKNEILSFENVDEDVLSQSRKNFKSIYNCENNNELSLDKLKGNDDYFQRSLSLINFFNKIKNKNDFDIQKNKENYNNKNNKVNCSNIINLEDKKLFCEISHIQNNKFLIKDELKKEKEFEKIHLINNVSVGKNNQNNPENNNNCIECLEKLETPILNNDINLVTRIEILPELITSEEKIINNNDFFPNIKIEKHEELFDKIENNKTEESNLQEFCEIENIDSHINDEDFDIFSFSNFPNYKINGNKKLNQVEKYENYDKNVTNIPNNILEIEINNKINTKNNLEKNKLFLTEEEITNNKLKNSTNEKILFSTDCTSTIGDNLIKESKIMDIYREFNKSRNKNISSENSTDFFVGSNLFFKLSSFNNENLNDSDLENL